MVQIKGYFKPIGKTVEGRLNEFVKSGDVISQFLLTNHFGDVNIYILRRDENVVTMYKHNPYGKKYVYIFEVCKTSKKVFTNFPTLPNGKMKVIYQPSLNQIKVKRG